MHQYSDHKKYKEFWVCKLPDLLPAGNLATGIGMAYATLPTRREALEYIMVKGLGAVAFIEEVTYGS